MQRERSEALAELISRLTSNDREILLLRHFEGFSFREIAEMLELSYANVRQRHVRMLLRLRDECAQLGIALEVK